MTRTLTSLAAICLALPAAAQETRDLGAHEHGVSTVEIAVESGMLEIDILSPGVDIVGFEYEASTPEDKDAVEAAIRQFLDPESIVTLPDAAGCRLTEVLAHLHTGDQDHDEGDHDHDHDHAEGEDHDHAEDESGGHSEFHASYAFACEDEAALTTIGFPFFELFGNAREIDVQYVTASGAGAAELAPDAAELTLE